MENAGVAVNFIKLFLYMFLVMYGYSDTIQLYKGWNLIGSSDDINLSNNFQKIKIAWSYDNSKKSWSFFSKDSDLKTALKEYKTINIIPKNSGCWILSEGNATIKTFSKKLAVDTYRYVNLKNGWNLFGSSYAIDLPATFKNGADVVWSYDSLTKKWSSFSPIESIKSKIKDKYNFITSTKNNDAFWVYSKYDGQIVLRPIVNSNIITNITNTTYKYRAIKIEYPIKIKDKIVTASSLLTIPLSDENLSIVCDNHGTFFDNSLAPTNREINNTVYYKNAKIFSGDQGFIGIFPDYLGYGSSYKKVAHPYIIANIEAVSSKDAIEASLQYLKENNITFNNSIFVTGYSEGGYNAMALAKYIQDSNATSFKLKATAPMAGPYDIEKMADTALKNDYTMPYPAILGYIAFSYSHYYDVNLTKILNESATSDKIDSLYTNLNDSLMGITTNRTLLNISNLLDLGVDNHKSQELFNYNFLSDYENGVNNSEALKLKNAFKENNLYNWTPKMAINLIQCSDDDIIPFSMSKEAYETLQDNGASVILSPLTSTVDLLHPSHHLNCESKAYQEAISWFKDMQ